MQSDSGQQTNIQRDVSEFNIIVQIGIHKL